MEFLAAGLAWAVNKIASSQNVLSRLGLASLVAQSTISWPEFSAEISPQLSPRASVILQHEPLFINHTSRWRDWHSPDVGVVVKVFTENDVQATIRVANEYGLPFLARSGGHGATESLSQANNVIIIDLREWDTVNIAEDGKIATIGGGASVKKVVNTLWAAGKQTVTGICECVGISAPVLGGGHGWLQGQYGLASDQVVSAKLVLPNGEAVTASLNENSGLFWALRGAGHNFGIVTEWQYRVHDINNSKWFYEIFIFLGEQLGEVFELTNKMMKTQPPETTHWIYFVNVPEIDLERPVIWYGVIYDGPLDTAMKYTEPLHKIHYASAFPHRDDNILVTPYIMYKPNASIDAVAQEHGKRLRNHLLEASDDPKRLRAYVNYAHGNEPLEAMYGWEDWRLELLKITKAEWDPENRMRFYSPLE
ncbi:FAD-linked oxidoreductase chyH [Colletotrichum spaethianum]|uniref:FAD-linked oxidoreductase chyH n=1 Tax=Colletotrichum spaethianum TaxID=700344 RepID=A0AA37P9K7_9PEZI|nr:FAD-linked oxidoreductase chyH [Colletotrichum spaethianum]GKT48171.1 FAD-linked oxidoreductase chyH [Colletotrichum spaethianum]